MADIEKQSGTNDNIETEGNESTPSKDVKNDQSNANEESWLRRNWKLLLLLLLLLLIILIVVVVVVTGQSGNEDSSQASPAVPAPVVSPNPKPSLAPVSSPTLGTSSDY